MFLLISSSQGNDNVKSYYKTNALKIIIVHLAGPIDTTYKKSRAWVSYKVQSNHRRLHLLFSWCFHRSTVPLEHGLFVLSRCASLLFPFQLDSYSFCISNQIKLNKIKKLHLWILCGWCKPQHVCQRQFMIEDVDILFRDKFTVK